MIYDKKINWHDPSIAMGIVGSTHDPFKSAVIDYHTDMEAAISDLIDLNFRDPGAYDVDRAPFQTRIQIARALIGPTPDDDVWDIVKAFSSLRNTLAHSSTAYTQEGRVKTERQTRDILKALQKVRPEYTDEVAKDRTFMIAWAAMTVQGFFRKIREALSRNNSSVNVPGVK